MAVVGKALIHNPSTGLTKRVDASDTLSVQAITAVDPTTAMYIGSDATNDIIIGNAGFPTAHDVIIEGNLKIKGTVNTVTATTFSTAAIFNGHVTIGTNPYDGDELTVNSHILGDLTFGNAALHNITAAASPESTQGRGITITAGDGGVAGLIGGGTGGNSNLYGGAGGAGTATQPSGSGGDVNITSGVAGAEGGGGGVGNAGGVYISAAESTVLGGRVYITGGEGSGATGSGGDVKIYGGGVAGAGTFGEILFGQQARADNFYPLYANVTGSAVTAPGIRYNNTVAVVRWEYTNDGTNWLPMSDGSSLSLAGTQYQHLEHNGTTWAAVNNLMFSGDMDHSIAMALNTTQPSGSSISISGGNSTFDFMGNVNGGTIDLAGGTTAHDTAPGHGGNITLRGGQEGGAGGGSGGSVTIDGGNKHFASPATAYGNVAVGFDPYGSGTTANVKIGRLDGTHPIVNIENATHITTQLGNVDFGDGTRHSIVTFTHTGIDTTYNAGSRVQYSIIQRGDEDHPVGILAEDASGVGGYDSGTRLLLAAGKANEVAGKSGGDVEISGGKAAGHTVTISGAGGNGGAISLLSGTAGSSNDDAGGAGGAITLTASDGGASVGVSGGLGGNIALEPGIGGTGSATGRHGSVLIGSIWHANPQLLFKSTDVVAPLTTGPGFQYNSTTHTMQFANQAGGWQDFAGSGGLIAAPTFANAHLEAVDVLGTLTWVEVHNITLDAVGGGATRYIQMPLLAADNIGDNLVIQSQSGRGLLADGGTLQLKSGNAGTSGAGGALSITAGTGKDAGALGGDASVTGGAGDAAADGGGQALIKGGLANNVDGFGGNVVIAGGGVDQSGAGTGVGGSVYIRGGQKGKTNGTNGDVFIGGSNTGTIFLAGAAGVDGIEVVGVDGTTGKPVLRTVLGATINLPGGAATNPFQIDGTPVGATVLAPALDTLTAGSTSNASALHRHEGVGSVLVTTVNSSTAAISAGQLVGFGSAGGVPHVYPVNILQDMDLVGGSTPYPAGFSVTNNGGAAPVTMVNGGVINLGFALWQAMPTDADVGLPVFAFGNAGKVTITPPTAVGSWKTRVGYVASVSGVLFALVSISIGDPTAL